MNDSRCVVSTAEQAHWRLAPPPEPDDVEKRVVALIVEEGLAEVRDATLCEDRGDLFV